MQYWRILPQLGGNKISEALSAWGFHAWGRDFSVQKYQHKLPSWLRAGFPDYWSLEMWGTDVYLIDDQGMVRATAKGTTLSDPTSYILNLTHPAKKFIEPEDRLVFLPKKLVAWGTFNPLATVKVWGLEPSQIKAPDKRWRTWKLPVGWSVQCWDHELRLVDHLGQLRGRWGFIRQEPRMEVHCHFQWSSSFALSDTGPYTEGIKDAKDRAIYSISDIYIPDNEVDAKISLMRQRILEFMTEHFPHWRDPLAYWELGSNEGRTDRWRSVIGKILTKETLLTLLPGDRWSTLPTVRQTLQEQGFGEVGDGELYSLLGELKLENKVTQGRHPFNGRMQVCYRRH